MTQPHSRFLSSVGGFCLTPPARDSITTAFRNPSCGAFLIKIGDDFYLLSQQQAARLVTFPMDYPFAGTQRERDSQVGSCIPPRFAYYLGLHIKRNFF